MKLVKWLAIAAVCYVALVVAFETFLALAQPPGPNTMTIVTVGESGQETARVVSRLESDGTLYVAANHWPRAWYDEALANPRVLVRSESGDTEYTAVPVTGSEHDRIDSENPLGFMRFLMGFAPRAFLRLDPA